jgi:hypothetical protein
MSPMCSTLICPHDLCVVYIVIFVCCVDVQVEVCGLPRGLHPICIAALHTKANLCTPPSAVPLCTCVLCVQVEVCSLPRGLTYNILPYCTHVTSPICSILFCLCAVLCMQVEVCSLPRGLTHNILPYCTHITHVLNTILSA